MPSSTFSPSLFLARAAALARFESVRALRAWGTLLGALVFTSAHALGRWQEAGADGFFVLGSLAAYVVAFSPGLSADRGLSFDRLLVLDLLSPLEYAVGKTAAMIAWSATSGAFLWTVAALFSGGDVRFAGWYTAMLVLLTLAAMPVVVATDLFMGTRLPAAAAFLLAVVVLVLLMALGVEPQAILGGLGFMFTPYSWVSLGPLLLRACVGVALTPVLVGVAAAARGWPRTRYLPPSPG